MPAAHARIAGAAALLVFSTAFRLQAQDPTWPPPPPPETVTGVSADELRFESARVRPDPEAQGVHFSMHGELQLRAAVVSELRLRRSDGSFDDLGQEERAYYWLRPT